MEAELSAGDTVLLKIVPNESVPGTFTVEGLSKTGAHGNPADKLWLAVNSLSCCGAEKVVLAGV